MVLFHFVWVEKGNDPETAEATMEGLAFPSPPSRAAGSEEAGRRSCLSFPANVRKIDAGKRVLSRREGGLGNGVNLEGEPASRFPLPTGTGKTRSPCLPFSGRAENPALRPRGRLPLGSLYERFPVANHGEPLVKNPDGERGRFRIVSQTISPHTKWKRTININLHSLFMLFLVPP